MVYISEKMAEKYYGNILALHQMNNSFINKVPAIEDELEEMLALPELAGIYNETGGQIKWLNDNRIRRKDGKIESGEIPADIVTGLLTIFPYRNRAKHEKKVTYGAYLGIFDCMARAISFFSNTPIPDKIQAICDGKAPVQNQGNSVESSQPKQNYQAPKKDKGSIPFTCYT